MRNKRNTKGWFKSLTPEAAWKQYVGTQVEFFLSNFRDDGYTDIEADIEKMCYHYANEIPKVLDILLTLNQIELIAKLIAQHIRNYIEKKGGIKRLELYTTKELETVFEADKEFILKYLR